MFWWKFLQERRGNVIIKGPDKGGIVTVVIFSWEFRFIWPEEKAEPEILRVVNLAKSRAYQKEDIEPPNQILDRAKNLARIRFCAFGKNKDYSGEQLPLPF